MEIEHDREQHRFKSAIDGEEARVDYEETADGAWDLQHTWVPEEHRNQGIASDLVRHVLERADDEGRNVIPTCPFVASFIDDNPPYEHLVDTDDDD